jgi:magnesium chelatase family protein
LIALEAKRRCRQTLVVSHENAAEAAVVEGVDVYGGSSLSQVVHFLRGDIALEPVRSLNGWSDVGSVEQDLDFGEVKGQQHVKRAVEVAPARGHNWIYSCDCRIRIQSHLLGILRNLPAFGKPALRGGRVEQGGT